MREKGDVVAGIISPGLNARTCAYHYACGWPQNWQLSEVKMKNRDKV